MTEAIRQAIEIQSSIHKKLAETPTTKPKKKGLKISKGKAKK